MISSKKHHFITFLLYSLFIACIFLLVRGYQFNSGDQAEHLPQVYKLMDPSLYKGDYFIEANEKTYTVRFFYVWLMYGLSFIMPVSAACFILCLGFITLSVYSFTVIAGYFSEGLPAKLIAPLLVFLVFYHFTLGSVNIQYSSFICSTIGTGLAAYGILCYFRERYLLMSVILGLASLFQLMDAAQVFLLMLVLYGIEKGRRSISMVLKMTLVYFLCALPMLLPMIYKQFLLKQVFDTELYYRILYQFRNPHHFLPSYFPLKDYLKTAVLLLMGLYASRYIRKRPMRPFYLLFAFIISGMLIYYLMLEKLGINSVGKLQWFKTSIWMSAFSAVFISAALAELIKRKWKTELSSALIISVSAIGTAMILTGILNSRYLPFEKLRTRYQAGNYTRSDLSLMHEWIAANTPADCMILSHPGDDSFACEAKRPSPVGYKAIIHEPFFMLPWYEDFSRIYGVSLSASEPGKVLKEAGNNYENSRYKGKEKITYRIDDLRTCKFAADLDSVVFRKGDFVLSYFNPSALKK